MSEPGAPMLEDEISDILRKAMRGTNTAAQALAKRCGLDPKVLDPWLTGKDAPNAQEAAALAEVLGLDGAKLAEASAGSWHPSTAMPDDVRHHPNDPHPSNGYVVLSHAGKAAALIDPAGHAAEHLRALQESAFAMRYILITHKHADHCDATAEVARMFPQARIVMHRADVHAIGELGRSALPVVDGDELPFNGASIRMLHTPGHTDGSSCYLVRSDLFSGDTLFAGSIGGAFGEKTSYDDILTSIESKLFTLPDDTVVLPGHGPPSTIEQEKAHNPFFRSRA